MWIWINQQKGGRKGNKEKKKGKAAKGKRAEEKKFVLIFQFFIYLFHNLILIFRLPLEKNGSSPRSKAKKTQ